MRPPPTILARLFEFAWFRDPWRRRGAFAAAAVVTGVLCLYPEHYVARSDLMPGDSGGGMAALLDQSVGLVSLGALLGNHQSIEADLTIGRSESVIVGVVDKLHLVGPGKRFHDLRHAEIAVRKRLDISAVRGSILQITATSPDPDYSRELAAACAASIQDRLTDLSLRQAAEKRAVATNRLAEATKRLAEAQKAITLFRTTNKLAAPELQLGAGVTQLATLQGELQAKQVQLATLDRFATGRNVQVQAIGSAIAGLQNQIAAVQTSPANKNGPTLQGLSLQSSQYFNLYRNEQFAQVLFGIYSKYMEEVTIDELTANANIDIIQPAYVEPRRQYNIVFVVLLFLIAFTEATMEFYVISPPIGVRRSLSSNGASE